MKSTGRLRMTNCFGAPYWTAGAVLLSALSAIHCGDGDDSNSVTCGAGTVLSNGTCVPASGGAAGSNNNGGTGGGAANGGTGGSAQAGASGGGQSGSAGQSGSGGSSAGGTGAVSMWEDDPCPPNAIDTVLYTCGTAGHNACLNEDMGPCQDANNFGIQVNVISDEPFEVYLRVGPDGAQDMSELCGGQPWKGFSYSAYFFDTNYDQKEWFFADEIAPPWRLMGPISCGESPTCRATADLPGSSVTAYVITDDPNPPVRNLRIRTNSQMVMCE